MADQQERGDHTEEKSKIEVNNERNLMEDLANQVDQTNLIQQPPEEEQTKREITQTDHLNRKLLGAFLDRINSDNSTSTGESADNTLSAVNDEFEDEMPEHWLKQSER